jgi:hypothetical protein
METTETTVNENANIEPDMILAPEAQYYLQEAGKWASFLGIMGFIGTGLLVLAAVFASTLMSYMNSLNPARVQSPFNLGPFLGCIYFLCAVFYFFFSLYLYQFGKGVKSGVTFGDSSQVTIGLEKLKSFFKLWGITTIVILCFYALFIVIGIIAGIAYVKMHG